MLSRGNEGGNPIKILDVLKDCFPSGEKLRNCAVGSSPKTGLIEDDCPTTTSSPEVLDRLGIAVLSALGLTQFKI